MHPRRLSLAHLVLVLAPALAGAQVVPPSAAYRLGPKDLVRIRVFEVPELNVESRISESGMANLPLIGEIPPPPALFQIGPRRVVGLTIAPDQLILHRVRRQRLLGLPMDAAYADLATIEAEVAAARRLCHQHGFAVVDVTDRTIEECATEIMPLIGEPRRAP